MAETSQAVRFVWWNVESFAHFDANRAGEKQWPLVPEAYSAKCDRIDRVLTDLFGSDPPELLALAEVTHRAATDLRDRLLPEYDVFSLDQFPRAQLQVAFLHKRSTGFEPQPPLVVPEVPRGTRPMAVIDIVASNHRIRFIGCHWTARFEEESGDTRSDTARFLNSEIFRFLKDSSDEGRHVIIVGDLNEEPFGLALRRLHAYRDRATALRRAHYTDQDTKRIRLYNCSWRYLGERHPHGGAAGDISTAGTYFWKKNGRWSTPDQIIVTGTMLTGIEPFLDETGVRVLAPDTVLEGRPYPMKFDWNNGEPKGISDHLPVSGRVILRRGDPNANL